MECLKQIYLSSREMYVPCGSCAFCCATKRSDWALRLKYEHRLHYGSKFVTLTYSNNNLTFRNGNSQLVKKDLQDFFKRLRKAGHVFRYFAVGEYGSTTYRPHYHILLFGDVPTLSIEKAWSRFNTKTKVYYPLGHVHTGQITDASVMYCLGYVVNGKGWKMKHNRQSPFSLMSRGRGKLKGLGSNYLTAEMIRWHRSGRKNYAMIDGVRRHLPRYYKLKIFSKVDLVRIAVQEQKEAFARLLRFIRDPKRMRMRDPLEYYEEQRRELAKRIKFKSKENLVI